MRKRIFKQFAFATAIASIGVNISAMQSGLYLGLTAGPATNSASEQQAQIEGPPTTPPTTVLVQPKSQQFGSRLLMGYMINPYVGMEGGFSYYSTIRYVTKGDDVQTCGSTNARITAFDFVGKGVVPFQQANVFGKAGVAATYQSTSAAFYPSTQTPCGNSRYITKFVPTYTIGVGYDLNQNWGADISMNNLLVGSKFGNVTTYGLSLTYHFVDVYCGQFLC